MSTAALSGIALPLAAFDAILEAAITDPLLATGKTALPATRGGAIDRARHVLNALEDAGVSRPDTFVLAKLAGPSELVESWHGVPLYPVHFPDGRMMKAVIDPFLRRAPLGLLDWQGQLGIHAIELVPASEIIATEEASGTLREDALLDITTKRGGSGTVDDCHGLAKLLRAWLKDPTDRTQVARFRRLFGEVAWRALESTYPKLVKNVERALSSPA